MCGCRFIARTGSAQMSQNAYNTTKARTTQHDWERGDVSHGKRGLGSRNIRFIRLARFQRIAGVNTPNKMLPMVAWSSNLVAFAFNR